MFVKGQARTFFFYLFLCALMELLGIEGINFLNGIYFDFLKI